MKRMIVLELIFGTMMLMLTYTGLMMLINFSGDLHDLKKLPILNWLSLGLVNGVPPGEIPITLLLLFETIWNWRLLSYLALMLSFTFYICHILLLHFPGILCSSGGRIKYLTWTHRLGFNLFIGLTVIPIWLYRTIKKRVTNHIHA